MFTNPTDFVHSRSMRDSLKRGLARQAIDTADRAAPDLPDLLRMAADLRPNAKALERLARRIMRRPGVSRVVLARNGKGLSFTIRAVRMLDTRVEGQTAFHETGLVYLRAQVRKPGPSTDCRLTAVSFCAHALERLVERSDHDLRTALLPQVDAEAEAIFLGWDRGARIEDGDDEYYRAVKPGLWAGGHDEMAADAGWNLSGGSGALPVFSARTFLSGAEMRPTVLLRWRDDPFCRMG